MSDQLPTENQENDVRQASGSGRAIGELAERLLWPYYYPDRHLGKPDSGPIQLRLVAGRIPGPLPVDIPIPNSSRIIGCLVLPQRIAAVLDVDLPIEDIITFYTERLTSAGWSQLESLGSMRGGFIREQEKRQEKRTVNISFCQGEKGPALHISATSRKKKPTDVHVTLDVDSNHSPCSSSLNPLMKAIPNVLPRLAPPLHSEIPSRSSGSSSTYAHSETNLISKLDLAAVHDHYAEQLETHGWKHQSRDQAGTVFWSTWTLEAEDGDEWQAQLVVIRRPWSKRKYVVAVHAELAAGDDLDEVPSDENYDTRSSFESFMPFRRGISKTNGDEKAGEPHDASL